MSVDRKWALQVRSMGPMHGLLADDVRCRGQSRPAIQAEVPALVTRRRHSARWLAACCCYTPRINGIQMHVHWSLRCLICGAAHAGTSAALGLVYRCAMDGCCLVSPRAFGH